MKLSPAIFAALEVASAQRDPWRLPTNLDPLHYNIRIKAYLDPEDQGEENDTINFPANTQQHFDASATIKMSCAEPTSEIILNSLYLDFDAGQTSLKRGNADVKINSVSFDTDLEQVTISLDEEIKINQEIDLSIDYRGYLQPNNFGFYISYYENEGVRNYVASSQMQGPYARRVFPGFDEPGFKAEYSVTMEYQQKMPWSNLDYYPLSNMPYKGQAECEGNWCTQEFEKTVKMSSYLTAFAIVDFGSVNTETSVEKTPANLYARQQLIGEKDQAMSATGTDNPMWFPAISTERVTDQFGSVLRSYKDMGVGKADQIALPDFNAGAMENWGLVTYREQSLLYDMNRDRFDRKFYVANVVSHEMAHMWFGDFVTCQFWDELWLNEAFATFISYVGLEENRDSNNSVRESLKWNDDSSVGTWDLSRSFIANRYPAALQHDQTTSSNPIVNIENNNGKVEGHPQAGSSNIIYSKGGIILKNIRCFLGDEVFFGGLQDYLEKFKYSNPDSYDLTQAWEEKRQSVGKDTESEKYDESICDGIGFNQKSGILMSGKTVGEHWDPWLRQMGYPFLTVSYSDDSSKAGINVEQKRFLNNPDDDASKPPSKLNYKWPIPLQTAFKTNGAMKYMATWIENGSIDFAETSDIDFAIVNADYVSFFRTKYDGQILDDLLNVLSVDHTEVPSFSRANFVADYFAFAENKPLTGVDITDTFEYTSFMAEETDFVVWKMFDRAMSSVRGILKYTDSKDVLDGYLSSLVQKYYDNYGYSIDLSKIVDMDREAMNLALLMSCQYGNADCLANSKSLIEKYDGSLENEPDRDQKLTAYCYGIQESGQGEWDKLWASYANEQNANELYSIRYGLACSKDPATIKNWLQLIKGDDIRTQDKHTAINQVSGTEVGRNLVWEFIEEEWQWIKDKTLQESWTRASSIISTCTSTFSTAELKQKVAAFRSAKSADIKEMGLEGTFANVMTTIDKNIKWREENEQNIVNWINENGNAGGDGGDAAAMATSVFFVLASILL